MTLLIHVERQSDVRDSIGNSEDKGDWSLVTKDHVMPDESCIRVVYGWEHLPGYGLNNDSNLDIPHKRQPARAPTVLYFV